MNTAYLFAAVGLMLVFEGLLPFICPECWKRLMILVMGKTNRDIRMTGFLSMLVGVIIIYLNSVT